VEELDDGASIRGGKDTRAAVADNNGYGWVDSTELINGLK